ncbi:MAG: hypothetical protein KBG28_01830 [Kofleriaceae bacterium]|nr:hypothetical protein [Kofleriaceae bacterium]
MTEEIEVELGEEKAFTCGCCGGESTQVLGYVYEPTATIVYRASFIRAPEGHDADRIKLAVSIGGWGEGTGPGDRAAVALELVMAPPVVTIIFPAPKTSPFHGQRILGRFWPPRSLPAEDRARLTALATLVMTRDPRLAALLHARGVVADAASS